MNWLDWVASRIRRNLRFSRISEKQKEAVVQDELARLQQEAEVGQPHVEEPRTSRGEKLSSLRARAHSEWENTPTGF